MDSKLSIERKNKFINYTVFKQNHIDYYNGYQYDVQMLSQLTDKKVSVFFGKIIQVNILWNIRSACDRYQYMIYTVKAGDHFGEIQLSPGYYLNIRFAKDECLKKHNNKCGKYKLDGY